MIDRELKKKLAHTLAIQLFGHHRPSQAGSAVVEQLFEGLSLMNRLEDLVTKSFRAVSPAPEAPIEQDKEKSFGEHYLTRHTLIQKRIHESNRRMTHALLDLARRHAAQKTPQPSPEFTLADLKRYSTQETEVKRNGYFKKSSDTSSIFLPTRSTTRIKD